jgi:glutamine synthetase
MTIKTIRDLDLLRCFITGQSGGIYMNEIKSLFGSMVFNEEVMRERLPKDVYLALKKTMAQGTHLKLEVANPVANAMKNWALEKGATHYTHWFQPMTGITAEKHDSFISLNGDGKALTEFSGRELVRGEPDASSLPSGGLRATFEARGYTAWDPTSYAFIKDRTLCIPTAFCSYSGQALDKKTPLLRSMEALDTQAKRILKLFGNKGVKRVFSTVGSEQEYFLIDREMWLKRLDLICCGRTLFGARPPKGQEMDDHYFGAIKPRVSAFMKELDEELWKLGVPAKTEHNETAPGQHELAPIYETTNIATDHNQITMELMKSIATKHGLACLLHEKPFEGVNGSGKHNNWSLSTDKGTNLLEPGDTPYDNLQFLLLLVAVIKAVDDYQDLLRASVASAGNDHRLGGNEAPPAVISIFLGEELTEILEAIEASVLPHFPKDVTDRNRTSPFAFTGNKFEFRMLGSASSIAEPNIVLNTIVAESLSGFADILEVSKNFDKDLTDIIRNTIREHKRIIFNGNNYSGQWAKEAERRGLLNLSTTVDAIPYFIHPKNIALFEKHGVFTETELHSRYEIMLENYCKTIYIEAITLLDMVNKGVIPSVIKYQNELAGLICRKKEIGNLPSVLEENLLSRISALSQSLDKWIYELERSVKTAKTNGNLLEAARYYCDTILKKMRQLRIVVDELEANIGVEYWAYPTYADMLYSVN